IISGFGLTKIPDVSPDTLARAKVSFNETDTAYAYYNSEDAFDYVTLMGHHAANSSDTVSFVFGYKVVSSRIESAKIVFYLRNANRPNALKALIRVVDDQGVEVGLANVTVPNSPTKR
ncbi:hypothetical protein PFISCL1PPCAC_28086, partial [Pristionchus fissidentatus]